MIRVTFPYYRAGDIGSARAVEATFDCTFDTATGAVTAVSVSALGL